MGAVFLAWLVHLYSATGVVLGFFSIVLVVRGDYRMVFWRSEEHTSELQSPS